MNNLNLADQVIEKALKNGADKCDAIIVKSADTSSSVRFGNLEGINRSESLDIGLRVFVKASDSSGNGYKTAIISTNNLLPENLDKTIKSVIDIAKISPIDKSNDLAKEEQLCKKFEDLEIFDSNHNTTSEELIELAKRAESAALEIKGITNSEGADASFGESEYNFVTSNGFSQSYKTSGFSISTSVIGGEGTKMETDYDFSFARIKTDLMEPEKIGRSAANAVLEKLNPRKVSTQRVPVIFDKKVSKSLLANLAASINGETIFKGTIFLTDFMDRQIFANNISIIDDPKILRGIGSQPFDAEGLANEKIHLVENGVLKNWILDLRSAKKLGLESNGRASRGLGGHPHPTSTNVYMENGEVTREQMISEVKNGLYLTDLFGMGINTVNGDYSQGANGFWIENGEIAYPVSEITIAGHLLEMFKNIDAANDLEMRYSKNAPTLRIAEMTIAGS